MFYLLYCNNSFYLIANNEASCNSKAMSEIINTVGKKVQVAKSLKG